ncbi:MAG: hypothetical protein OEV94_06985 [Deltaproteobacteria bacterium]|nr:hypothetical protein [Deltaproteobacteria bacterium]
MKQALWEVYAQRERQGGSPPGREFWLKIGREVEVLHEAYTEREAEFSKGENPIHGHLGGYQFYYLPRNLFRVAHVLSRLNWRGTADGPPFPPLVGGRLRIADIGCGSGAFSLAWLGWLGQENLPPLEIALVDQGRRVLDWAEDNLRAFARLYLPQVNLTISRHTQGVVSFLRENGGDRFSVAGGGMALNELGLQDSGRGNHVHRMARSLAGLVTPGGLGLWVEPGTRQGFLNVMALREHLTEETLVYPCPHGLPCPMKRDRPGHWCHETPPLPMDFYFDQELRDWGGVGFSMREVNLSGLAFRVNATNETSRLFQKRPGARVVSERLPARGSKSSGKSQDKVVMVCTPKGTLEEQPALSLPARTRGWFLDGAEQVPMAGDGPIVSLHPSQQMGDQPPARTRPSVKKSNEVKSHKFQKPKGNKNKTGKKSGLGKNKGKPKWSRKDTNGDTP